ncbi:MAG TPA: hypothetical protein VF135_14755 [Terriglobales bacterium]
MIRNIVCGTLLCCCGLVPAFADDQQRSRATSTTDIQAVVDRVKSRADTFEDKLERALDRSSLNGSHLEDRLNRWSDILEDSLDNLAEDYKAKRDPQMINHLEDALIVGSGINRVMLRKEFGAGLEADWNSLRADLNQVASQYHRPPLPNIVVTTVIIADPGMFKTVNVRQAMERLESSTDRFEDRFRKTIQHSTANMTKRETWWDGWADALEDSSDDMLKEYKKNDAKEFNQKLQDTLVVAAAINRIMLRSDFDADTHSDWRMIRSDLNAIANAFGQPVLPETLTTAAL